MLLRYYIKYFTLPALQQAVSYKRLHNQVERCGLRKRTCDTVVQSAVLVAVCRYAAKRDISIILTSPEVSFQDFAMQLKNGRKHHSGYLPIVNGNTTFIAAQTNSDMLQNSSDLYNGNIARMVTTITDPNSRAVLPLGNAYRYDQLNRLKHAVSFDQLNGNAWAGGAPAKYQNSFTYDANGNILTQTRNDDNNQVIDELAYFYPQNAANKTVRNRLLYVSDNVDYDASDIDPSMSTSNYTYDEEGRLIKDLQEEIASIEWRVDGKVKRINRIANSTKQNLSFDYDAMGHRIAKHVYTSANVLEKSTFYVLDAQGNTMATYERSIDNGQTSLTYTQTEKFIYGSSRLGVQNVNIALLGSQNNVYSQTTVAHRIGKKGYELSNHLGNVLSVISDKVIPHSSGSTIDYWQADILQSTDYSPFGVQLNNRTHSKSGVTDFTRFGFQNQEMDDEIKGEGNSVNYTFRMHDPRLGRFFAIDPLYKKFAWNSVYAFSENKLIAWVELEGLESYFAPDGTYLGSIGASTEIRIVNQERIDKRGGTEKYRQAIKEIENGINSGYKPSKDHLNYLNKISKIVTVEEPGEEFKKMWETSIAKNTELAANVVLDVKEFKLTLEVADFHPDAERDKTYNPSNAGEPFNGDPNKITIANIHTHPSEHTFLGKKLADGSGTVTDNYNFNNQYSVPGGDGKNAQTIGNIYTMSNFNIDFFSQDGKKSSVNNISSRKNLQNGQFNLLIHALKNFKK